MESPVPVELLPVDIAAWAAGNTGIPYATTLDSGRPGSHVLVAALTHGNEVCGAHALKFLFERGIVPERGRLTLVFNNVAAYATFDPAKPAASRFLDEDFNRVWDMTVLDGPRTSRELARAREIRPLVDAADFLLDIHSMQSASPALMLCGVQSKGRALARSIGYPAFIVADTGHAAGRRMRDYSDFADDSRPRTALLVECGQHWQSGTRDVAVATMLRFLAAVRTISRETAKQHMPPVSELAQRVVEVTEAVTIKSDRFAFAAPYVGMEVIASAGTVIGTDGDTPVATPYDDCVLIMPTRRLQRGQTAVRLGRFAD
ncbi:MAG TPA: succinylglutamate desuccinylase/aspartoacylase family protein [Candidatus Cybelea sp.]|nr:succinylglutamate desuccinylase/aspartoacylase family protein [Candidatus Cybelea sp.]